MAAVKLAKITKSYPGGAEAVKGIDLEIADGELLTLVGPSGCGKSTTLNLIAGFEQPTSGTVSIDGEIVNHRSPSERGVAMVFQSYALYPHMSVRDNIAFPLDVAGVDKPEIASRVREMAERLGIGELLGRKPKELSGGQRQRVALGRALVRRPRLCLFDEPLSNLDARLRGQMRAEIKKLHEDLRATFVYVTHDQTEAMTLSDRIVILDRGLVQQVAPPREIYDRPVNAFVAGFIGAPPINLVAPSTIGMEADDDVLTGIRPEHVTVGSGPPPDGAVVGKVYVAEPTGAETWVTLDVGGERVTGRAPAELAARSGDVAWLVADRARVLRFDASTRARLDGEVLPHGSKWG
jgi:multiple sugar transport system ATP-binding protein